MKSVTIDINNLSVILHWYANMHNVRTSELEYSTVIINDTVMVKI